MKAYRIWVFIVAAVAVVAVVRRNSISSPEDAKAGSSAGSPKSSWTLFGGIGATAQLIVPTLKVYEGGAFDLENLTVVQFVDKYRSIAKAGGKGAADAAYRIYQAERMCAEIPETEERLQLSRGSEQYANALGDEAEACVGLPPTWLYERYQFLKQAAQDGIEGAAITFYEEGPPESTKFWYVTGGPYPVDWSNDAIKFLRTAGEHGDICALHRLSYVYQQGELVPPDPQTALTYKAAMVVLQPYILPGGLGTYSLEDTPIIKKLSAGLPPDQIATALKEGRAIAAQCCDKH